MRRDIVTKSEQQFPWKGLFVRSQVIFVRRHIATDPFQMPNPLSQCDTLSGKQKSYLTFFLHTPQKTQIDRLSSYFLHLLCGIKQQLDKSGNYEPAHPTPIIHRRDYNLCLYLRWHTVIDAARPHPPCSLISFSTWAKHIFLSRRGRIASSVWRRGGVSPVYLHEREGERKTGGGGGPGTSLLFTPLSNW